MPSDALVFHSLANSDIAPAQKSQLLRAYEAVSGSTPTPSQLSKFKAHGIGIVESVRSGGEAIAIGGILGAIDATMSLDLGPDKFKVPVDGFAALLGFGGAVALAHSNPEISTDFRTSGAVSLGILTYRKTKRLVALKTGMSSVAGEASMGNDPLDKIAERL